MNRLMLAPLQAGYSVQLGNDVISQRLEGGASRHERATIGSSHTVNLQWACPLGDYQYLMAFYRIWQRNPSQAFVMRLVIDAHVAQDYQCHFVPESIQLTSKSGAIHYVSAQVEAKALIPDDLFDEAIVTTWNAGLEDSLPLLEQLVNQDLPDALENL
jgi:hypothetical protein